MDRTIDSGRRGFTLVEMLVALAVSGAVLAIIAVSVERVAGTGSELSQRSTELGRRLVLRRLLHRDLQGINDLSSLAFSDHGLSFTTSHNHLLEAPLPVRVTWSFADREILRSEELEELEYRSAVVLARGLEEWDYRGWDDSRRTWLSRNTLVRRGGNPEEENPPSALILKLRFGENLLEITERLPYVGILQASEE
jgi:prepilin-type N-terminal cleavage/methylation domain-containing protein